jgi:large subunit ribosomal protein L22
MQATARLKYLMMSPRKVRRVVSLIKGKSVQEALNILKFTNKAAASPLAKTIQSATANALAVEGTSHLKAEDLSIVTIRVDEGPRAKRIRFRAMGRVFRYKKRFAHLTVVVEGEPKEESPAKKRRVVQKAEKAVVESDIEKTQTEEAADEPTAPKKTGRKAAPKAGDKAEKVKKSRIPRFRGKKTAAPDAEPQAEAEKE